MDFIKGFIFISLLLYFLARLGKITRKSDLYSENLIYGFVIYTCLQFFGGCVTQLFRLPWLFFKVYMIIILIIIILICVNYDKVKIEKKILVDHFKTYGVIYIMAVIFVCLACMNIQYQWNSNNIDDGYYLNKIAMAPYLENFVDYNYAVGLPYQEGLVRIANTFEIEAAFYAEMLGVSASFYCKFILSFINYTLILNAIYWLYYTMKKDSHKIVSYLGIFILPVLMFGISQEVMNNYHLLYLHDGWQFNTAIWYGSSLVRTLGFIILLIPLVMDGGLTKKNIFFEVCASIALFSKASQIIPVVLVVLLAEVFMFFVRRFDKQKKYYIYAFLLLLLLCCIPQKETIVQRASILNDLLWKNGTSIVLIASLGLFIYSFFLSSKIIKTWNMYLIIIGALLFVPRVNGLFLISSIYDFVMARTMTLYLFTFVLSAIFYGGIALQKVLKKNWVVMAVYLLSSVVFLYMPMQAINNNLGLLKTVNILLNNKELLPDSTLKLGEELSRIQLEQNESIKMLSPAWVMMDGVPHSLASMVRYQSPDIISVSALPRYNSVNDMIYQSFTQEEQNVFELYSNGTDMDDDALTSLISSYDINCIVVTSEVVSKRIESLHDFGLRSKLEFKNGEGSYFILIKGR